MSIGDIVTMKSKENIKKASEEALEQILRLIEENLNEKDAKDLYYELAASCFTFALNFDQDTEKVLIEATVELSIFRDMIIKGITEYKLYGNGVKHYESKKD